MIKRINMDDLEQEYQEYVKWNEEKENISEERLSGIKMAVEMCRIFVWRHEVDWKMEDKVRNPGLGDKV